MICASSASAHPELSPHGQVDASLPGSLEARGLLPPMSTRALKTYCSLTRRKFWPPAPDNKKEVVV